MLREQAERLQGGVVGLGGQRADRSRAGATRRVVVTRAFRHRQIAPETLEITEARQYRIVDGPRKGEHGGAKESVAREVRRISRQVELVARRAVARALAVLVVAIGLPSVGQA